MPFFLSRFGSNVPAEVQRWQYFLRRQGFDQVGNVDAAFGIKTETATKYFQVSHGINPTGEVKEDTLAKAQLLGYTILADDYYQQRARADFPTKPTKLSSPTNAYRNKVFTCFNFLQLPLAQRPDAEAIVQKGSCTGSTNDWVATNVVTLRLPQPIFAKGFVGTIRCHAKAAPVIAALFAQWEKEDLLHLIISYDGCFVPRYKRNKAPGGSGGHLEKQSSAVAELSNHSFGSAFDINAEDNPFNVKKPIIPALCGRRGSVRELVASANTHGLYWGGHFSTPDGMHFEISKLP